MNLGRRGFLALPKGTWGPRLHPWLLRGTTLLLCMAGGLALVGLPLEATMPALDPSWVEAYVYFTKTKAQAGVDYLFTYGPLAHFIAPAYDPDLYTLDLVMAVVIAVLLIAPFVWAAIRRRNVITTLFLFWLVFALFPRSMGNEVGTCCAIITMTILLLERPEKSALACAAVGAAFAFLSLLKFSMMVMCGASMGVLLLQCCVAWKRSAANPRWCVALAMGYGVSFVALWLLAGQDLQNLWVYIAGSIEISRAYVMGMHTPLNSILFYIGLAVALALAVQIGLLLARKSEGVSAPLAVLAFACIALLLAWKMGVARSQIPKFWVPAATVSVLLATYGGRSVARQCMPLLVLALVTTGIVRLYGTTLREHVAWSTTGLSLTVYGLATPGERKAHYDRIRDGYRNAYDCPEIKRTVGNDTVDILTPLQSVVMFNDLNYHPRPVFQGYQACSPRLAAWNGAFYDSASAPKYVLRLPTISAIDGRFPMAEDAEVLKSIFRNYRPVLCEDYLLLLERKDNSSPTESDAVLDSVGGTAHVNEWIALEDPGTNWQMLSLHLKPSVAGRVREFLYQPPMPMIEIRHSDGMVESWRINIGAIESGFIINPVFDPVNSVEDWPGPSALRRVEAIRVTMAEGKDWMLQPKVGYSVETVPPLARAAE